MLKTWILILTLAGGDGHAIHSVEGFTSEATCQRAATLWIRHTRQHARSVSAHANPSAVCVERK